MRSLCVDDGRATCLLGNAEICLTLGPPTPLCDTWCDSHSEGHITAPPGGYEAPVFFY